MEISDPKFNWLDFVDWSVIHLKGKSLRAILCILACWATIYHKSGDQKKNAILRAKGLYSEDQLISHK